MTQQELEYQWPTSSGTTIGGREIEGGKVSQVQRTENKVPKPASYTKGMKISTKSHTSLSHGRDQTHLPVGSIDMMSAQPCTDYRGGLVSFFLHTNAMVMI